MVSRMVQSKEAASYGDTKGKPDRHCSICEYWIGSQGARLHTKGKCEIVSGAIQAWGGCRLFQPFKGGHE